MIRHIFMAPLRAGATEEQLDQAIKLLSSLPTVAPEIKAFTVGRNLGFYQKEMNLVLTADFNDLAGWQAFMENTEHLATGEKAARFLDFERIIVTQTEIL